MKVLICFVPALLEAVGVESSMETVTLTLVFLVFGLSFLSIFLLFKTISLKNLLNNERKRALQDDEAKSKILFLQSRYASMGETIGNIAHQWKQPLNAIGSIQNGIKAALIFQGEISKAKLLESVETSFKLLRHLAETIDTFYGFLAQRHNETKNFIIADELETIRKITEYSFENSGIKLVFELEANPAIRGNPNEFTHALLNLILNARESLDEAETDAPLITVRVSGGEQTCIITVTDNGGGIRIDPVELIFSMHVTSKPNGSGLGLFMAKNIIEKRFGGTITAKNIDNGACLRVELPYAEYGEHFGSIEKLPEQLTLERINQLTRRIIELEEARNTLSRWADIFKHARWGIAIHMASSNAFELTNPAFDALYGYTSQEMKSITVPDLFAPEFQPLIPSIQEKAFREGYAVFETLHRRRDGSLFPVEVELIVIKNDEQEVLYHIANIWDLSEKKASEKRLMLKKFALNRILDAVFLVDEEGVFQYVNEGACKALGYTAEELVGMNVGDINPDWPQSRWPEHWSALKASGSITIEVRHLRKDGSTFPVEVSANYFEYDGQSYNMAIIRDITVRKETEKQLRLVETAVNHSNDAIYIVADDHSIIYVSETSCRMLGYTREEFMKMKVYDVDAVMSMNELDSVRDTIDTRKEHSFETRHKTKDGRIIDVSIATTSFEHNGTSLRMAIVKDITERKQMEKKIHFRERYQRTLLDNFPYFVWLKDQESRLLAANMQYARVAKVESTAELEGKTDFDFFPQELAKKYVADDQEVMREGISKNVEEQYADEYGQIHWMETWKSPVWVDGEIVGTVGCSRDITERKNKERKIRLLSAAMNSMYDGIWIVDTNNHVLIYANDEACRMLGYDYDEMVGMNISDIDKNCTEECLIAFRTMIFENHHTVFETTLTMKNSIVFSAEVRSAVFELDGDTYVISTIKKIGGLSGIH